MWYHSFAIVCITRSTVLLHTIILIHLVSAIRCINECLLTHNYTWASCMEPRDIGLSMALASARIQWWALILAAHSYKIRFKPGNQHNNADVLSHSPLPESPTQIPTPGETILLLDMLHSLPVTTANIKWTYCDPVLSMEWGTWSSKVGSSQMMHI